MTRNISLIVTLMLGCLVALAATDQTTSTSQKPTSTTVRSTQQKTTSTSTTSKPTTTPSTPSGPTLTPEEECAALSKSCDDCVKNSKCMYCYTNNTCSLYPTGKILPTSVCSLAKARWGVCWVNFEALIIACSVIGGAIIITITCCCIYCCCCRGNGKRKYDREDARFEQQKMERKMKQDERRTERKSRLDEIRRKYGLVKDDAPYQRFDA